MILVDHPNVLKSYCSFVKEHNLWVVMPFMPSGSCLHNPYTQVCPSRGVWGSCYCNYTAWGVKSVGVSSPSRTHPSRCQSEFFFSLKNSNVFISIHFNACEYFAFLRCWNNLLFRCYFLLYHIFSMYQPSSFLKLVIFNMTTSFSIILM